MQLLQSALILTVTAVAMRYIDWNGRPLLPSWRAVVVFVVAGLVAGMLLDLATVS